jgi:hypothetical protein
VSEEQHENAMNFDIVEDRTTDVHENISIDNLTDIIPDDASSEEYIMSEISQVAVANRRFSGNQPENVVEENIVEENIVEDGRLDVNEIDANVQDKIAGVSENILYYIKLTADTVDITL